MLGKILLGALNGSGKDIPTTIPNKEPLFFFTPNNALKTSFNPEVSVGPQILTKSQKSAKLRA